ncbi:MAG: hypothetical protein Unbinned6242contig1001_17 [Prokaryotic dsDNA virus sp.]|nr:MAG: hypothetical protein Unbinned6242contig1001_17 [Prokaryotic dsDNA virus sp.]|tara:strand:+ start:22318 stop:24444 length:2127 start_codon:yes stop_codon:yes gene_type:complete
MPKVSPLITNFQTGEISPRLDGRVDLAKYPNACTTLENAIVLPQGAASRRGGFHFVAEAKDSSKKVRLINFEFSTTQAYVIELGDQTARFHKNQGQITTTTGSELISNGTFASNITGWTDKSVGTGSIAHATDHMNIVSTNSSNYGWAEDSFTTTDDKKYQLDFTVTGGSLTLIIGTATGGTQILTATSYATGTHSIIFTAESTTTYIGFYHQTNATIQLDTVSCKESIPYEIATPYIEDDLFEISYCQSADYLFLAHRSYAPRQLTRSGHTNWTLSTISFTGSSNFPSNFCAGSAGAGSDGNDKNPGVVTFFEERLMWAGSNDNNQTIWGSSTGSYFDMAQGSGAAADSVEYTLAGNAVNVIQWLAPSKSLLIGTMGGEFKMDGGGSALTPSNVRVVQETNYGSKKIEPIQVENVILFLQRAGRKLREFVFDFDQDNYVAPDLTILAEHLSSGGFVDTTYQQEEDSIVWAVRSDGVLCGMTYLRGQNVIAWHRHITSGLFESITTIPRTDANRDEVWVVVKRTINGSVKRFIEYLDPDIYLDSGRTYSGTAATTFTGLKHLIGESIQIVGNDAVFPNQTVVDDGTGDGTITLSQAVTTASFGLGYTTTIKPVRPEVATQGGTSMTHHKRWNKIAVRLLNSTGVRINGDQVPFRSSADEMDQGVGLFTGDKLVSNLGWDRDGYIEIKQEQPLPLNVLAITGTLNSNDI